MAIEVKIGVPNSNYQGIWKNYEESHAATFHGYGLGVVDWENDNKEDELKITKDNVIFDFYHKVRQLANESIFKSYGVYNYDKFFERYAIKTTVALFDRYEKLGDLYSNDFQECFTFANSNELMDFFGKGEFPFIEYGYIHREDGGKLVVYFISR